MQKSICMDSSPGHCLMAPLGSSLVCTPADNLRHYQVLLRYTKNKGEKEYGIWSLVDIDGPVETAQQGTETHQVEDCASHQVTELQETKWLAMQCIIWMKVVLSYCWLTNGTCRAAKAKGGRCSYCTLWSSFILYRHVEVIEYLKNSSVISCYALTLILLLAEQERSSSLMTYNTI